MELRVFEAEVFFWNWGSIWFQCFGGIRFGVLVGVLAIV